MVLRFIGKDCSLGLHTNLVYEVKVFSAEGYIWVKWDSFGKCPYSSPQAFAKNWEAVR